MTFKEFEESVTNFLSYLSVEKNLAHNTQRSYESDLHMCKDFWLQLSHKEPEEILLTRALERYFVSLYYKKIQKNSIARKISCFRSLGRFLKKQGVDLDLKVTRPKNEKKLPVYLHIDEIIYLLDGVKDEELPTKLPLRDRAIFELLYATGIRCSELCSITMKDIDFKEKVIRIFGKGRKERLALFGSKASERLQAYLKQERYTVPQADDPLFANH